MENERQVKRRTFRRWLRSTSNRTFIVYPVAVVVLELLIHQGQLNLVIWGIPLLPWGYLQFRWCGAYRTRHGGGGPGLDVPPDKIVDTGIYAYSRNPMYMGHLIFMIGLAITFQSLFALALFIFHCYWFQQRVLADEKHLVELFGDTYLDYMNRVKRWLPGVL